MPQVICPIDKRFVRQKIKVDKILPKEDCVLLELDRRIELYKNNIHQDEYPMDLLMDKISNDWDPACRELTLHREPRMYSPFTVCEYEKDGEIYYSPDNGLHRIMALKLLEIKEVDAFVFKSHKLVAQEKDFHNFLKEMEQEIGEGQQYQTLNLPYKINWKSRDDTLTIFNKAYHHKFWCGKTVLDISGHIGTLALEAKRYGASRVVTFDLDGKLIKLGKKLSNLLELEIEFYECDFWDFPLWGEQFDIVMAHQCMYHFNTQHRCAHTKEKTIDNMLDLVLGAAKEDFFSYTFVYPDDKPSTYTEGYRPTESQVISDLSKRGFNLKCFKYPFGYIEKRSILAERQH